LSLRVESITASYGNIKVLWDVSMNVEKGSIVSLIGANGAGKSSLLKCILGVLKVQNGSILFQGMHIDKMRPHSIVTAGIGYVPEGRRLFPTMSVHENLRLGAPRNCYHLDKRYHFVTDLFPVLKDRSWQAAGTLSGGEQQMVAIGRALMSEPSLLILDELSFGLSPKNFERVLDTIMQINRTGVSILLAEQNAERALEISSYTYVMENGRITHEGKSSDLINDARVRSAYLGISA
jgi:branched-chain amino acid transport system ATP-binding protein